MIPTLTLRPLAETDVDRVASWFSNDDILRTFLLTDEPVPSSDIAELVVIAQDDPDIFCWVVEDETNAAVGMANARRDPIFRDIVEIEVTLGADTPRRSGAGTEAHRVAITEVFTTMGARKVVGRVAAFNEPMVHILLKKLGIAHEGTLREHVALGTGPALDLLLFGVLRAEWQGWTRPS